PGTWPLRSCAVPFVPALAMVLTSSPRFRWNCRSCLLIALFTFYPRRAAAPAAPGRLPVPGLPGNERRGRGEGRRNEKGGSIVPAHKAERLFPGALFT